MNIDNKKLEKNKFPFSPRVIVRLMRQGYIIIKKFERLTQEDKLNFFHTDYVVTLKGYDKFCKLREVYQKDWSFILTITNIIVAITTIILFTKAMGWW